jgi:hypothetical protein
LAGIAASCQLPAIIHQPEKVSGMIWITKSFQILLERAYIARLFCESVVINPQVCQHIESSILYDAGNLWEEMVEPEDDR